MMDVSVHFHCHDVYFFCFRGGGEGLVCSSGGSSFGLSLDGNYEIRIFGGGGGSGAHPLFLIGPFLFGEDVLLMVAAHQKSEGDSLIHVVRLLCGGPFASIK